MNRTRIIIIIVSVLALGVIAGIISFGGGFYYNRRGLAYLHLRQYVQAADAFSQAIRLNSSNGSYYNNRGLVECEWRQYPQALNDLGQAIRMNPRLAVAYANRGLVYRAERNYTQALQDFTTSIRLKPTPAHYVSRSSVYFRLNQYANAIDDCNSALQLDSNFAVAYYNRGRTELALKFYPAAFKDI